MPTLRAATPPLIICVIFSILAHTAKAEGLSRNSLFPSELSSTDTISTAAKQHQLFVATNLPAWAMLMINAEPELQLNNRRLSVSLPIYYSGFNYFTSTRKFRTVTLQPTLRVWFTPDAYTGWWVGPHLGISWFDVARGGAERYQDNTPVLGGGVSAGWRRYIGHSSKWMLELSIGAGVYSVKYDVYANHRNGPKIDSRSRVWGGIDRVTVGLTRVFQVGKPRSERSAQKSARVRYIMKGGDR